MDCIIINHFQLDVTIKVPLAVRVFKSQHRNSDIFALIKESIKKCIVSSEIMGYAQEHILQHKGIIDIKVDSHRTNKI